MKRLRTGCIRTGICAAGLITTVALGVSGCGTSMSGSPAQGTATGSDASDSATSAPSIDAAEPTITEDQMAFVDELLADPLSLEEATAAIEAAGYTWRIGEIDGEGQSLTTDYVTDRLTLFVQEGTVVRAVWG